VNSVKWALGLVTRNFLWKILALAIAVTIWVLVANEPELSTFTTVRVAYRNIPDDLELSSAPTETVTLELRGPAGEVRGAGESRSPAVVLDMSGVEPGQRTFEIGDGNVTLARGVRLVRSIPTAIRFEFDRRMDRVIPVHPRFTGEGANGYVVGSYTISPDRIPVTGPASRVARVDAAITDPVDVSSAVGTFQLRVNAFVMDSYVRLQSAPQVVMNVAMKKK
jgi:YbbR domain-containing protein